MHSTLAFQQSTKSTSRQRRSRILFMDHTAKLGGGEIAILNLVRHLNLELYEPVFISFSDGPLVQKLRDSNVTVHVLSLPPDIVHAKKDELGAKSIFQVREIALLLKHMVELVKLTKQIKPDIIHTNSLKSDVIGGLVGRLTGVPVVWHIRDRITDQYLPPKVAKIFKMLCRYVPNTVIANSNSTLDCLELPGLRKKHKAIYSGADLKNFVVNDGVDLVGYKQMTKSNATESPKIALIGRISPWKGQHIFIKAAAQVLRSVPSAKFLIVGSALFGESEYEAEIHKLVKDLGIESAVEFIGFTDDVPGFLSTVEIVVHASTLGEPFGQVVIEAMASAKPIIATDGGAIPEIVEHGVTGLIVPMSDVSAMAEAITVLAKDDLLRNFIAHAGHECVKKRFTIERTADLVMQVYSDMLVEARATKR